MEPGGPRRDRGAASRPGGRVTEHHPRFADTPSRYASANCHIDARGYADPAMHHLSLSLASLVSSPSSSVRFLLPLLLGCSTADGLGGSGDTGEPPVPPDPLPAPDGQSCDEQTLGWHTECEVLGQIEYENPLDPGQFLELAPFTGPTLTCCEGNPSQAEADAACVQRCV
jgi:hypothetical protein